MMKKRGQIYLLVALVMAVVIFGLVSVTNKAQQESLESDFERLSENYAIESARLVNSLLESEQDVGAAFNNFSLLFTSYSKTQSPDFGLIYAFNYKDKLFLGNYLKEMIGVSAAEQNILLEGCYAQIPASVGFDGLTLNVGMDESLLEECTIVFLEENFTANEIPPSIGITIKDIPYQFTLAKDQPEVIMVSWESKGEQRKVFTEGELEQGGTAINVGAYCVLNFVTNSDCDPQFCEFIGNNCFVDCDQAYANDEEGCNSQPQFCDWNENMQICEDLPMSVKMQVASSVIAGL